MHHGLEGDSLKIDLAAQRNLRVFVLTFGILALELALIRWTGGQVRVFAYFGNLVLVVVFLGLGLGIGFGRQGESRLSYAFPTLGILALLLGFAPQLGFTEMIFPDRAVALWGSGIPTEGVFLAVRNTAIFGGLIVVIMAVFVFLGTELGALFKAAGEHSIDAYTADLAGSLAGTVTFALLTTLNLSPPAWLALGVMPLLVLALRPGNLMWTVVIIGAGVVSIDGARFSPYNRIDIGETRPGIGTVIDVNRDFHQVIRDFSEASVAASERQRNYRTIYDAPFRLSAHRGSAVIVGAGTGNDAAAALRNDYQRVVAVDIDPLILEIGAKLHPSAVYADSRVETVNDDARAFFRRYDDPKFDAVVYGLLDSHAMFSSVSTIRLDNFVYTVEGFRDAWKHVADGGHMVVGFSVLNGEWLAARIYRALAAATGIEPVAYYHGMHAGASFVVARDPQTMSRGSIQRALDGVPVRWMSFDLSTIGQRVPTDDWPFLYVNPGAFPWLYLVILGMLLAIAAGAIPVAYGSRITGGDFSAPMFFLGAAFLLLETRSITALSLLYGSTWIVNAVVFAAILSMALIAALWVRRRPTKQPLVWFIYVIAATLLLWLIDWSALSALPIAIRGLVGALVHAVPMLFAGILFPLLLARARNAAGALGSNLLGAVVGGCLEYSSMIIGLKSLLALTAVFYLLAAFTYYREGNA